MNIKKFLKTIPLIVFVIIGTVLGNFDSVFAQNILDGKPPHFFQFKNINMPATVLVNQNFTLSATLVSNLPVISADEVYVTISGSENVWIYGDKVLSLGTFGKNTEKKISYQLEAIEPGPIVITLKVTGIRDQTVFKEEETTTTVQAIETMASTSSSLILFFTEIHYPAKIVAGKNFEVTANISNTGAIEAKNIFVTIEVPNGILLTGSPIFNFEKLKPSSSIDLKFDLKADEKGSYEVKLIAFSSSSPPVTIPFTISVDDPSIKISLTGLKTNPLQLYPGDMDSEIKVGLTNYGQQTLDLVSVRMELLDGITPSWSASNISTLGILPPAKDFPGTSQQSASFYVDIDKNMPPGNYDLKLRLETFDGEEIIMDIPIVILPKATFEVKSISYAGSGTFGTEILDSVSPGKTTVVRVTMGNIGTAPAEFIVAQLQTPNDFEGVRSDVHPSFGNVDSLGMIFPGQDFHSTFFLNVDETVDPGYYPGTIRINWQQGKLAGEFSQAIPITINVSEQPTYEQIPYLQIFLGGVSGLFLFLYLKSRKQSNIKTYVHPAIKSN